VVATGGGREADRERGVATLAACSTLIMLNNLDMSLFVDHVASTCFHRPTSMFWSHLTSIAIELTTFCNFGGRRAGSGDATDFLEHSSI
jgi:hypothetical protein